MELLENQSESIFEILSKINVSKYIQKKNNLSFLSWSHAWSEVKKHFPNANYKIYEDKNGCFYHTDEITCWVKTGVTINSLEHIEYLPVMNFKNKSIPRNEVTSFDVNKAIQRSLTKALARHGLGLYVYAGEDLPETESEKIEDIEAIKLLKIIKTSSDQTLENKILKRYKVNSFKELNKKQYKEILNVLEKLHS